MDEDDALSELDDLLGCESLTNWEQDFVEDMDFRRHDGFTDGMMDKIHEIWMERYT